jgi:hypothetical protein
MQKDLTCPITLELLDDPISVPCCGMSFSRSALIQVFNYTKNCPWCRKILNGFDPTNAPKNIMISNIIEQIKSQKKIDANPKYNDNSEDDNSKNNNKKCVNVGIKYDVKQISRYDCYTLNDCGYNIVSSKSDVVPFYILSPIIDCNLSFFRDYYEPEPISLIKTFRLHVKFRNNCEGNVDLCNYLIKIDKQIAEQIPECYHPMIKEDQIEDVVSCRMKGYSLGKAKDGFDEYAVNVYVSDKNNPSNNKFFVASSIKALWDEIGKCKCKTQFILSFKRYAFYNSCRNSYKKGINYSLQIICNEIRIIREN